MMFKECIAAIVRYFKSFYLRYKVKPQRIIGLVHAHLTPGQGIYINVSYMYIDLE